MKLLLPLKPLFAPLRNITCCMFLTLVIKGQPVYLSGSADSTFPVFNNFIYYDNAGSANLGKSHTQVYNTIKHNGVYYSMGDFSHVSANHGPALVIDTATNTVLTPQKWKINGLVKTAVPDGTGGFYIGGTFTRIGDSVRRYIARINANGAPTAWRPVVDSFVNVVIKRNDTLFIGGAFKKFSNINRSCFAMYSINGDTLINNGGTSTFTFFNSINAMLVIKDTLVYGGSASLSASSSVTKYNFKNKINMGFVLQYAEYSEIQHIQISKDTSTLICQYYDNGFFTRGSNYRTGTSKYLIKIGGLPSGGSPYNMSDIYTVGNKTYLVGLFNYITDGFTNYPRRGMVSFNSNTGVITSESLTTDGYATFVYSTGNKIYFSGRFTTINGASRNNFVALDTGTLAVSTLNTAPSDNITALAFSGSNMFAAGEFKGVYAVKRNGFAAIDATTHTILPWNPAQHDFIEGKRMFARGDSLFVLGIYARPNGLPYTRFKIYSLTTGNEYPVPSLGFSNIQDCVVDGNYLYISGDKKLRRYSLPGLPPDNGWGKDWNNFNPLLSVHNPMYIIVDTNRIYTVGDTRFQHLGGLFDPQRGYTAMYDKTTGQSLNISYYEGANSTYDPVRFEHALLLNNKLYIAGLFSRLNGQVRRKFACVDAATGVLTAWQATFPNTDSLKSYFENSKNFVHRDGKIWFGAPYSILSDGSTFSGFGAIDTATGNLTTPPLLQLSIASFGDYTATPFASVTDYAMAGDELVITGVFDGVNNKAHTNIAKFTISSFATTYTFTGAGNWSNAANWSGGILPPATLPAGTQIIIDPPLGVDCILTGNQVISSGASLTVMPGKRLIVAGNLTRN
jgi:trimeric autotransporter adhesin